MPGHENGTLVECPLAPNYRQTCEWDTVYYISWQIKVSQIMFQKKRRDAWS